jgi:serine/threonine protein kinase
MEHVAGGNLLAWSEAQGGMATVPLATRLDLAAQVAEAIAAAHSVGALHKDLKPGNVLVQVDDGSPAIRLCDFGSGTVLDPARLEGLGITRLGFTKTLAREPGGTPLYLAPEVIAGQPFTVQADIYALGILLYQIVAGDLRKALAPGWEADVEDELLREDIAAAAAGNPAKRLTDAAQLAERLRTLEQRREARAAEVAAKQRAERARRNTATRRGLRPTTRARWAARLFLDRPGRLVVALRGGGVGRP